MAASGVGEGLMSRRLVASVCCVVVAALALSACSNARKTLGLEKKAPDEFSVVARAPLALPPDYQLRPPEPGKERPQEKNPTDQARSAVLGNSQGFSNRVGMMSPGEQSLLKAAGADNTPSDIRQQVNRETSVMAEEERSFTDRLVFWREQSPSGTIVNAQEESKRLRNNQALGKEVTDGDVPRIERKEKALLEGLF